MTAGTPHPELRAALMSALAERAPRVDRDRGGACVDSAAAAHGPQLRKSGQPSMSKSRTATPAPIVSKIFRPLPGV